jgi:hypothetical protein
VAVWSQYLSRVRIAIGSFLGSQLSSRYLAITQKLLSANHSAFFADQRALEQFTGAYTTATVERTLGLGRTAVPGPAAPISHSLLAGLSGYTAGFCQFFYSFVVGALESDPVPGTTLSPPSPPSFNLSLAGLLLESLLFVTHLPWLNDPTNQGGFGCEKGSKIANAMWAMGALPLAVDGCVVLRTAFNPGTKVLARNEGTFGVIADVGANGVALAASIAAAIVNGFPTTDLKLSYAAFTVCNGVSILVRLVRVPYIAQAIAVVERSTPQQVVQGAAATDWLMNVCASIATIFTTNEYVALKPEQTRTAAGLA